MSALSQPLEIANPRRVIRDDILGGANPGCHPTGMGADQRRSASAHARRGVEDVFKPLGT